MVKLFIAVPSCALLVSSCADAFSSSRYVPTTATFVVPATHHHTASVKSKHLSAVPSDEERAGTSGYSILRQPLQWDSESDPTFQPPTALDEEEELRKQRDISTWWAGSNTDDQDAVPIQNKNNDNTVDSTAKTNIHRKEEFDQTLDLFQRTMDTLDYPIVLRALADKCKTEPARAIIAGSQQQPQHQQGESNNDDSNILTMPLTAQSVEGVHHRYDALKELMFILSYSTKNKNNPPKKEKQKKKWEENNNNSKKSNNNDKKNRNSNNKNNADNSSRKTKDPTSLLVAPPDLDKGGTTLDVQSIFRMAEQGQVLEGPEILEIATILQIVQSVEQWTQNSLLTYNDVVNSSSKNDSNASTSNKDDDTIHKFVEIPRLTSHLDLPIELLILLTDAFDEKTGSLSGTTFPKIGELRSKIRTSKRSILSELDALLPSLQLSLESGGSTYSEVNGRIVVPVDQKRASDVGIVHDASRSGKTVYVEPTAIVGPTNALRQLESDLRREEARVWRELTNSIMDARLRIEGGVAVLAQLDLVMARMLLGEELAQSSGRSDQNYDEYSANNGIVIPEVRDEGVMHLKDAKHPVLLLRQLDNVVGSDIDLGGGDNQGLILTGPNSGGKTVILKLLGLVALMVRDGIPIPACGNALSDDVNESPPRVDYFDPVLADIGDIQSVDSDLSTFSGHMLVCREVLAGSGRNTLVLMDELGSGTDPAQGVAIAQALLEALMERGARVAITTHYLQLKQLASSDARFEVAGMQFVNDRPSYKLLKGQIAESFALSVAQRLNLPKDVIERANDLLDQDTRQMGDLIRDLEDQKDTMEAQLEEIQSQKREMEDMKREMQKAREKLAEEQLYARRDEAKKFAVKLEEKERVLEDILAKLKSDPSKKILAKSWDDIRYVRRDALTEAENIPGRSMLNSVVESQRELVPLADLNPLPELKTGDTLIICKNGATNGKEVKILKMMGARQIQISFNNMSFRMKTSELALPLVGGNVGNSSKNNNNNNNGRGKDNLSKVARRALAESAAMDDSFVKMNSNNDSSIISEAGSKKKLIVRTSSNTLDLRGCTFEEGKRKCEDFFSRGIMQSRNVAFVLHGHGTGVLKKRLREWFKRDRSWVKSYKAAADSDGGDAFTQVELKTVKL